MDALVALKTRRSVRAYEHRAVDPSIIEDMVDCARLAASAINIQPWEFVVVTERERLARLAAITDHGKFIADAAFCVAVVSRETKYFLEDGSAATQNLLLAARAHGLGACWVAGEKKPYAAEILRVLGVPEGFRLISLVPGGFPAETPVKEKRPLQDVIHWEQY